MFRFILLLGIIFNFVLAYEKDLTFTVLAGKTDCFYHQVLPNQVIDLEFQVIDSTHGELDISFQLADPVGRVIVADYKKAENAHRFTATLQGDYRFCFDNSFSTFSHKTVFFDLMIEEESEDKDYDDEKDIELGTAAATYIVKVKVISDSVAKLKDNVSAAKRLQELHSAHEARDRNLAEEMCSRVMNWSICLIVFMIAIGITQVIFIKSLFEEKQECVYRRFFTKFISQ